MLMQHLRFQQILLLKIYSSNSGKKNLLNNGKVNKLYKFIEMTLICKFMKQGQRSCQRSRDSWPLTSYQFKKDKYQLRNDFIIDTENILKRYCRATKCLSGCDCTILKSELVTFFFYVLCEILAKFDTKF